MPQIDRISILAASIMLTFVLARFVEFPNFELPLSLPGVYLGISININSIIALIVIGLSATGVDWLLRGHPALDEKSTYQHWLLPTLTAWAIGSALLQQPFGPPWWIGFGVGSGILILVVIAEYILVDPQDIRRAPASIALTAVAFALYLVLAIMVRIRAERLFLTVPAITLAAGLVSLRVLLFQFDFKTALKPAIISLIISGQITAALYYFPLPPINFSLIIVSIAYMLITTSANIIEKKSWRRILLEAALVFIITWGISVWIL
ncbi:MAG: hypothetical protein HN413_02785 [Chloroflexi bacterium]|nr:hypothetical protein [Chloroflexota bacterium]